MKKICNKIVGISLALSLLPQVVFAQGNSFSDMPNEGMWSYSGLKYSVEKGYLSGFPNGQLRPGENLTRAQLITIMNRVMGNEKKADISYLVDVSETQWFYEEISKGVAAGFIRGTSEETMSPLRPISRQEAFTIMARIIEPTSYHLTRLNAFEDGEDVDFWAAPSVAGLVELGIIQGERNHLYPLNRISRAEFAKIIYEWKHLEENPSEESDVPKPISDSVIPELDSLGKEKVFTLSDGTKVIGYSLPKEYGEALLYRINLYRWEHRLSTVSHLEDLDTHSLERAKEEAYQWKSKGFIDHQRPNGDWYDGREVPKEFQESFSQVVEVALSTEYSKDIKFKSVDELIEDLFQLWKNSPSHNRAMLHRKVEVGGVGLFYAPENRSLTAVYTMANE